MSSRQACPLRVCLWRRHLPRSHASTSPISKKKKKKSESPPSPLPPVSVFGPNKFSPAPPITSSYFLSGTALRKQSELRVRGGLDGQRLTRQEAEGKVDTHAHTHTQIHTHAHIHTICTPCQVKHLQFDTSCMPKKNNKGKILHARMKMCESDPSWRNPTYISQTFTPQKLTATDSYLLSSCKQITWWENGANSLSS